MYSRAGWTRFFTRGKIYDYLHSRTNRTQSISYKADSYVAIRNESFVSGLLKI